MPDSPSRSAKDLHARVRRAQQLRQPRTEAERTAWRAQFSPVPETQLTESQRKFVSLLRQQYPGGQPAERRLDGSLCFFAEDPVMGFFAGVLPAEGDPSP